MQGRKAPHVPLKFVHTHLRDVRSFAHDIEFAVQAVELVGDHGDVPPQLSFEVLEARPPEYATASRMSISFDVSCCSWSSWATMAIFSC